MIFMFLQIGRYLEKMVGTHKSGNKINSDSFEGSPFYDETSETLYFIQAMEGVQYLKQVFIPKSEMIKS